MITVEDLVTRLATSPNFSLQVFDYKLVQSFTHQLWKGDGLTEKQGALSLKIIKKYHRVLTADTGVNILQFINNPVFKNPFRQPRITKRISISTFKDERIIGKSIKIEFPYSDVYINLIRENKSKLGVAFWSKEERAWIFNLCEENITFLKNLIEKENFECDEEFSQILNNYNETLTSIESNIPTLSVDNGKLLYKNQHPYLPNIQSVEILPAIFEARRHGVNIWSEEIASYIDSIPNQILKEFLLGDITVPYHVDSTKNHISCLKEIVLNLLPCVFVIPGGSEVEKLTMAHNFLKNIGIPNEKMSVMFRLPSKEGKDFNYFVHANKLNNLVDENTDIVFISTKIPKPLFKAKIHFNSIINLGFDNAHYTSRNFIDHHQNLVYFSERPVQQRFMWSFDVFNS